MADPTAYFAALPARLAAQGFEPWTGVPLAAAEWATFHRSKVTITKMAKVATFAVVFALPACPPAPVVQDLSRRAYDLAIANKDGPPRGLGGSAVVYPVIVTAVAPPDVVEFVAGYIPKHLAAFEFPVVVELDRDQVVRCEKTPNWGRAYYRGFRKEVDALFRP